MNGRRADKALWRYYRPGAGSKTIIFSHLIRKMFPKKALVLCHTREIAYQNLDKIKRVTGFRVDMEMGDERASIDEDMFNRAQVIVSTVQTQGSGGDGSGRMGRFTPDDFGMLICDEAHRSVSPQWKRIIAYYKSNPKLLICGFTATPDRLDEAALGQIYDTVSMDYEITDAIKDGWLVPVKEQMITIGSLDFSQVRTTAGDLNGKDLARIMEMESNLQGVCSATLDIVKDKRTLVFTASVEHAERISEIFNRHKEGCSDWACAKTDKDIRKAKLEKFNNGQTQILCNVGLWTEGFDSPAVEVVAIARPTKSRALFSQMCGRGLRPAESISHTLNDVETAEQRRAMIAESKKVECLILDFVGNSGRHKLMTCADILGGKIDDEVCEAAMKTAKERGVPVDMIALLEEEQKKHDAEVARRAKLKARAEYAAKFVDPFGVLGLTPEKERGWSRGKSLSDKQKAFLVKQTGLDPEVLGYTKGRQILNELFKRFDQKLCSFKMARLLKKRGYTGNETQDEARKIIDEISQREGWAKRK